MTIRLEDKDGNEAAFATGDEGELAIMNAKLWWPYTMVQDDSKAGYLYTLVVRCVHSFFSQLWSANSKVVGNIKRCRKPTH